MTEKKKLRKVDKKVIAAALATTVASHSFVFGAHAAEGAFRDIQQASSWAQEAISKLQSLGIIEGDSAGDFRPLDRLTRQEYAAFLARALGLEINPNSTSSFTDVPSTSWSVGYIEAVRKIGLMWGNGATFRPNEPLTREEYAIIMARVSGVSIAGKGKNLPFKDAASISQEARGYVEAVYELGLLPFGGDNFNPNQPITREEMAKSIDSLIVNQNFAKYKQRITTIEKEGKTISSSDPVFSF